MLDVLNLYLYIIRISISSIKVCELNPLLRKLTGTGTRSCGIGVELQTPLAKAGVGLEGHWRGFG
jgi:hypothetical protein